MKPFTNNSIGQSRQTVLSRETKLSSFEQHPLVNVANQLEGTQEGEWLGQEHSDYFYLQKWFHSLIMLLEGRSPLHLAKLKTITALVSNLEPIPRVVSFHEGFLDAIQVSLL